MFHWFLNSKGGAEFYPLEHIFVRKTSISFKDKWGHCDTILLLNYAVIITLTALVRKS